MAKKLLIVDDNKGNSDLYKMRFEIAKWEVEVAYSAEQAIDILQNDARLPDAVLLDLMLPKMQGDELLSIIRKDPKLKDLVVIVLTAINLNPKEQEVISGEADDYILKISIMPRQLVERVEELVKAKQLKLK